MLYSNAHLQPSTSWNRVLRPRDGPGGDLSDHYAALGSFIFPISENLAVHFSKEPAKTPIVGRSGGTISTPFPTFYWNEVAGADSNAFDVNQSK